jgi:hypothetical protein
MNRGIYNIDLKAAATLLDPEDWENLIHDKEGKITLIAAKANSAATSNTYDAVIAFVGNTTVIRSLSGIFQTVSNTCHAVSVYASRKGARLRLRSALSRLASGEGCGGRYVGKARLELLSLHRQVVSPADVHWHCMHRDGR